MPKRRRKKRRAWLPWAASIALLAAVLWILLANVVFVVRDVQVVGAGEVSEADVRHLSGIRLGTRIGAVDAERVRLDVESDGRVAFVSLQRRLPGRVVLTVRPRTMDAVILLAGKILVLDSDGYVVEITDRLPDANAVYVTGLKASYYTLGRQLDTADGRCGCMKAVLEALKAHGATAYVSELSVADTVDLRIITRTGMTVLLGGADNMDNKIAWMAGALADLEARGETMGRLDVSSGTKADYMPPAAEDEEEEAAAAEEVDAPAGEVYSINGVIYVDGVAVESLPEASEAAEVPAS
ncbi:MAG: FtsQ-type POTRA domain-containing protein [Clostridia bacterium]|nr:FtsQ-type POTRA domain-containing protein [Clostridia bacterium]